MGEEGGRKRRKVRGRGEGGGGGGGGGEEGRGEGEGRGGGRGEEGEGRRRVRGRGREEGKEGRREGGKEGRGSGVFHPSFCIIILNYTSLFRNNRHASIPLLISGHACIEATMKSLTVLCFIKQSNQDTLTTPKSPLRWSDCTVRT